jgi:hypothetical protein
METKNMTTQTNEQMLDFRGATFVSERDGERLGAQLAAVKTFVLDGKWHTLAEISEATGAPEASVSARLRDLRRERHGSYTIQREYLDRGLWQYRLLKRWWE